MTLDSMGPFTPAGEAKQLVFINDPVAGMHYVLSPQERTARKMDMSAKEPPGRPDMPPSMEGKTESLGKKTIEGVEAEVRALPQHSYGTTVGDFDREKALVAKLPQARSQPKELRARVAAPASASRPSGRFKQLRGREVCAGDQAAWDEIESRRHWRPRGSERASPISERRKRISASGAASSATRSFGPSWLPMIATY